MSDSGSEECGPHYQWGVGPRKTKKDALDDDGVNWKGVVEENYSKLAQMPQIQKEALTIKVDTTTKYKDMILQTITAVDQEIQALETTSREYLWPFLKQTEDCIEINNKKMDLRKARPLEENVEDIVSEELKTMQAQLKHNLMQLVSTHVGMDQTVKKLRESKSLLQGDLNNKAHALQLDSKVLADDPETFDLRVGTNPQKMTIENKKWKASTDSILKTAMDRHQKGHKLRAAFEILHQDAILAFRNAAVAMEEAFNSKRERQAKELTELTVLRDQVIGELAQAVEQDHCLQEQLATCDVYIEKTRKQDTFRSNRPITEKVVDEVDIALKGTLKDMRTLHIDLFNGRQGMSKRLEQLNRSNFRISKAVTDKMEAMEIDRFCEDLGVSNKTVLTMTYSRKTTTVSSVKSCAISPVVRQTVASLARGRDEVLTCTGPLTLNSPTKSQPTYSGVQTKRLWGFDKPKLETVSKPLGVTKARADIARWMVNEDK